MVEINKISDLAKDLAVKNRGGDEQFVVLKTYDNEILAEYDIAILRENSIVCTLNGTEFRGVSGVGTISYLKNIVDITLVVSQRDTVKASEILNLNPTTPAEKQLQERKLTIKELLTSIWKSISL